MTSIYRITKDFWFLKAGLLVVENIDGNFFIPMEDQDAIDCPISFSSLVIKGDAVRANQEHFELADKFRDFNDYLKNRKELSNKFDCAKLFDQQGEI